MGYIYFGKCELNSEWFCTTVLAARISTRRLRFRVTVTAGDRIDRSFLSGNCNTETHPRSSIRLLLLKMADARTKICARRREHPNQLARAKDPRNYLSNSRPLSPKCSSRAKRSFLNSWRPAPVLDSRWWRIVVPDQR